MIKSDYIYTMTKKELIDKLRDKGQEMAGRILVLHNESIYFLNKMYCDKLVDIINADGLGQASSSFGDPRVVHVEKTLNELGFDVKPYGKEADLDINGYDTEVKGSWRRYTDKNYGICQSGNYNAIHDGRFHIFLKAKIDVDNIRVASLQLEIYFATSDAFESRLGKNGKTNRTVFNVNKVPKEGIIGIWEAVDLQ